METRIFCVSVEHENGRWTQFEQKVPVNTLYQARTGLLNRKVQRIIERKLSGVAYKSFEFKRKFEDNPAVKSSRMKVSMKVGIKMGKIVDVEEEERKRNVASAKIRAERKKWYEEQKRMKKEEEERNKPNENVFTTADLIVS